jgi:hypothetical protein
MRFPELEATQTSRWPMERFDVSDGFNVHDYRHGLKLLEEARETMSLVNREDFACPVSARSSTSCSSPNAG